MIEESVAWRALAAVRFLDAASRRVVSGPLQVEGEGVRLVQNRSGYAVILSAPGLEAHAAAFDAPPAAPAAGSIPVALTVRDPSGRYLPRRCSLRLPRDPNPDNRALPDSLFRPAEVVLFPSPAAATQPGWALVRAAVTEEGTGRPLGGALIRVERVSDASHLASGLSDARGEALVVVPGIPVTSWEEGEGPVLAVEVEVALEAVFDPAASAPPDPDDLEARRGGLPTRRVTARLASGRSITRALSIDLA